ncbi:MAG: VOC family protein [Alphaproteobacteria bacterium]|nr:VOC family protein [Alphaproteobacteria bacterium]MBU1516782.1 VOC family protein [Alphaproteobacteria bacterium]MBU2092476.1 VOC family protein [Alphaproteobacteria bacterium]MBU2152393.1 VOC family protein [Alphaproteobacteria bacterium]MBU2305604.1 VOC family protein [Alphaproteobacteria bacterium]
MTKPVKFAHVVYQTRRFDEMIRWYQLVFEADVVHQNPALAFMTYDDEHHRFAFANLSLLKPEADRLGERGDIGVNHVAYTYADAGDLMKTYARLKAHGIMPYWPVHHGIALSLYYRDPDGNRMEFQVDCGTVEEANAFMASEAFSANPIGVGWDPELLLEQYENGVGVDVLVQRRDGPMSEIPPEHGMS